MFWLALSAGAVVSASGYLLLFPFYATSITGMQIANVIHSVGAILFIALILAHINWRHQMVKDASAGCRSFVPATLSRDTLGS